MDDETRDRIQAAAWRRLVQHMQSRTDVQNIDLMNLAGFCRNCLSKWYLEAATAEGETVDIEQAKQAVYGMPYARWKAEFQK